MKKKNSKKMSRLNEILEMPAEIVSNTPKISILGFNEMIIENYKNIMEYEEFYIKINTYIGIVNINGLNLKLLQMNQDDIRITGHIECLDFEEYEDSELEGKNIC